MRTTVAACCLAALDAGASGCSTCCTEASRGEVALFDGMFLTGWSAFLDEPGVGKHDVWSVRDGVIRCKGKPLGYLYTDSRHESFRLSAEYRWPGEPGNSGIFLRINGPHRGLPRCIEVQLKHGEAGNIFAFHGMPLEGDLARIFLKEDPLFGELTGVTRMAGNEKAPGEWNRIEVVAEGPRIEVFLNGMKVNEASGAEVLAGPVGLQSEGGEIEFRNVSIAPPR
jgi:hypothetical protein